ncbi:MAG: GNAT family N-acetyltransferase [Planctomycetota bacterium]
MPDIEFREARPEDTDELLEVRNQIFPPVSKEKWFASKCTAAVAFRDGKMVGAIPLDIREFQVRPGVIMTAAFENAVGVLEQFRGQGLGTGMLDAAKKFLLGKADVLMVYRGAELSTGYNFYAKNLHYDITYPRPLALEGECRLTGDTSAEIMDISDALRRQEEMNAVFQSVYGGMGGFPPRRPGYWTHALDQAIFEVLPTTFKFIRTEENGRLTGYIIFGHRSVRDKKSIAILEIATRNGDQHIARQLLLAFRRYVDQYDVPKTASKQEQSPYYQVLLDTGFIPIPREKTSMMLMAYPLDPAAMAGKVWGENAELDKVEVIAWSPLRQVTLHEARGKARKTIRLEMKDDTLTRLLLSRVDLVKAVEEERVTALGATPADIAAIAKSLPFTQWEYHQIEYL